MKCRVYASRLRARLLRVSSIGLLGIAFGFGGAVPLTAAAQEVALPTTAVSTSSDRITAITTAANAELTALDRYVAAPDDAYRWELVSREETLAGTFYVIDLTSQKWLRSDEVDRTKWQHWLTVFKPKTAQSNKAMMFIGGGSNGRSAPNTVDAQVATIATVTGSVVAELKMVPNQPLEFHGDGVARSEDDLIAYTWDRFLETGDSRWPARMPMVKSVVRAMDTVQALLASDEGGRFAVDQFVVAGASKRGWTTWLTAAVDSRVIAIAPIVIDVLNMDVSMGNHHANYGFWAPAVKDYVNHRIMNRRQSHRYQELLQLVDPFAYRNRFTMPKCIINASGDQFFCPDSSQFYFDQLPGEKNLCYVPNADHSLRETNALESLIAFHYSIVHDLPRPEFSWVHSDDGQIEVRFKTEPKRVRLWRAVNPDARDFRVDTIGKSFRSRDLTVDADGLYRVDIEVPEQGWVAAFVQAEFEIGAPLPLRLTTDVRVLPETRPFSDQTPAGDPAE